MSLGLQFRGELSPVPIDRSAWLRSLEGWLRESCRSVLRGIELSEVDGATTLLVDLHPAAEAMRVAVHNDCNIVLSAMTSSAGPGYHFYICDLLVRMSRELEIRWTASSEDEGDETGYFESGNQDLVYSEMLRWLGTVCDVVLHESDRENANLAIAMPLGVTYQSNEFLVTQTGPRTRKWAESVANEPDKGKDFFPWWRPERDARYYRDRAACLMWTATRWRSPLVDSETEILKEVLENLQLAFRLDDTIDLPWREWSEVLEYLGSETKAPRLGRQEGTQKWSMIGYRRNPVRIALVAGWSISIPGRFAERWDDNTWCGWDRDITVWFTAFQSEMDGVKTSGAEILSQFKPDSEDIAIHEAERIAGQGSIRWVEEGDQKYWRLRARSATDGLFCHCTICYADTSHRELALEIWRSLTV
jgi:hypothetical protein